jgi:hypothetical protein
VKSLHIEELHILYSSPNIIIIDQIKENEVGGKCVTYGRGEECVQSFDWKARRKDTIWKTKA